MPTVIEAYCDESGIQEGAPKCVVAGWVASSRQWNAFDTRWTRASGGGDFHGKRFFARDAHGCRVSPYNGWTDDEAQAYLLRLVDVITSSAVKSVGAVVDPNDFEARTEAERRWLTGAAYLPDFRRWEGSGSPNRPYYLGFTQCIEAAAACVRDPRSQVHFRFDQQTVLAPYATEYYERAKTYAPPAMAKRLGEVTFKSSVVLGALQAADMLTHACYRRASKAVGEHQELDMVTIRLRPITFGRILHYHRRTIEERLDALEPQWRKEWQA